MSLVYQGEEKRDKAEFKELVKDLENSKKTGVKPTKSKKDTSSESSKDDSISDVSNASEQSVKGIDSGEFDIKEPEEESFEQKPKNLNAPNTQLQELNNFKGDINSEFNKQNKGISNIEDDLEKLEQQMFHSQGGDKTKRDDLMEGESSEDETPGFNLREKYSNLENTLEKNDSLISALLGGAYGLWHSLFGDSQPEENRHIDQTQNVPPAPYDPDYKEKLALYQAQHPEIQSEIKPAENIQKVEDLKLPSIEEKSFTPITKTEDSGWKEVSTVDYYRGIINDPNSSTLEVLEAKKELASHIQAHKDEIEMSAEIDDAEYKARGKESQEYLASLGDISDIENFDLADIEDQIKQEKMNEYYEKQKLTVKDEKSWWQKLFGAKDEEKLDPKIKEQIENDDLDVVEVRAIYNSLKHNPMFSKEDKNYLTNKIEILEKAENQEIGIKMPDDLGGEVKNSPVNNEIKDMTEEAKNIEKKTEKNVKDISKVDLVDDKKVSEIIKTEENKQPEPEIQSTSTGVINGSSGSSFQGSNDGGGGGQASPANTSGGGSTENSNIDSSSSNTAGGTTETAGNDLKKKEETEIDTKASDGGGGGQASPANIDTTNGTPTQVGSSPEKSVKPDETSKEMAKQTSPEIKPNVINNNTSEKEVHTIAENQDNFDTFDNANLGQKQLDILGTK